MNTPVQNGPIQTVDLEPTKQVGQTEHAGIKGKTNMLLPEIQRAHNISDSAHEFNLQPGSQNSPVQCPRTLTQSRGASQHQSLVPFQQKDPPRMHMPLPQAQTTQSASPVFTLYPETQNSCAQCSKTQLFSRPGPQVPPQHQSLVPFQQKDPARMDMQHPKTQAQSRGPPQPQFLVPYQQQDPVGIQETAVCTRSRTGCCRM